jgi:hypothetical protein
MGATPALRRSWLLATAGAVFVGLVLTDANRPRDSLIGLLVLAPLAPALGVALAYGPAADPAHEITIASPMSGLRLVLLRTSVVLSISVAAFGLGSLVSPARSPIAAAWLLPALALTGTCLVLMTLTTGRRAASTTTAGWLLAVLIARGVADDPLAAFGAAGQLVAVAVLAGAVVLVVRRRGRFDVMGSSG